MVDRDDCQDVRIRLCSLCLDGKGGECHTPGCALFLNRAPDLPLRNNPAVTIGANADTVPAEAVRALCEALPQHCLGDPRVVAPLRAVLAHLAGQPKEDT